MKSFVTKTFVMAALIVSTSAVYAAREEVPDTKTEAGSTQVVGCVKCVKEQLARMRTLAGKKTGRVQRKADLLDASLPLPPGGGDADTSN